MGNDLPPLDPSLDLHRSAFVQLPVSELQSAIVPVVVIGRQIRLIGTAFNVHPSGLFVTARHVIQEALDVCSSDPTASIFVMWIGSGADEDVEDLLGGPIPAHLFQINEYHDVGIIQTRALLKDGVPATYPVISVDTRIPKLGSPVAGVGYTKMAIDRDGESPTLREIDINQAVHFSAGDVLDIYPVARDSATLPFPCFLTTARFDGGMSGGPVFSGESGKACGVICTGFSAADDDHDAYTSSAAAILNVLRLEVLVDSETGRTSGMYEILNVEDGGHELSNVQLLPSDDGTTVLQYRI